MIALVHGDFTFTCEDPEDICIRAKDEISFFQNGNFIGRTYWDYDGIGYIDHRKNFHPTETLKDAFDILVKELK